MKNIIVREYLESLTESNELDYIFSILLEVMDFQIFTTPKISKGLAQYGKDIVAVGTYNDGVKKRFFFEIKGGKDRDFTTHTFNKKDGIVESIREAKTGNAMTLPIKIVLVHNGTVHPSVKETFDGFIEAEFPKANEEETSIFFGFWKKRNLKKATLNLNDGIFISLRNCLQTTYLINIYWLMMKL